MNELFAVRKFDKDQDLSFILATWLRGLYYGNNFFNKIPKDLFMKHYHDILKPLVSSNMVDINVACLKEDPEIILGYAVLNKAHTKLNWVFVKSAWRKIGVAKILVPDSVNTVTHLSTVGENILRSRDKIVFNPFDLK